ncbi:helicase HerA domain-containing protein [Actinosynnema sp. NPDC059797]
MPDASATGLPAQVIHTVAAQLASRLVDRRPGHCVRIDSIRPQDGHALVIALRTKLPAETANVYVLVDLPEDADGATSIPAERAVEMRNRKERLLVLLVPVGNGSAASSLDNSFERLDIAALLRDAGEALVREVEDHELRSAVTRVGRELGRSRPVEAWARYVAAVMADPSWDTVGMKLWMIGLVPDLGGAALLDRLGRNVRCVRAISRPVRAVAPVTDRLTSAGLEEGDERDRITRYLSRPGVDLSDTPAWASALIGSPEVPTFERWPLAVRRTVDVDQLRVDTFLKEDGTLRPGTQLRQGVAGSPPYAETGPDRPATVKLTWKTEPRQTDGIDRWLLEVLPPVDLRDLDTEPFAKQSVKGDKRQATVRFELAEEDLAQGALLTVRLTALDSAGQTVLLTDSSEAMDESQEFTVHWEAEPITAAGRRASTPSLVQARLDAALDAQDDLRCDTPSWDASGSTFSVRLGGRRTALLTLSPALVGLQRLLFEDPGRAVAWKATGRLGEVIHTREITPIPGALPPALAERRRRLLTGLANRSPRDIVETLDWDRELREDVASYCQSFRRALDAAVDEQTRMALLTLDTVMLSIDTAGHDPIAAVLTLPLHPMRLSWFAGYDETLGQWAVELSGAGRTKAERRRSVDGTLVRRVTPANLPFVVPGIDDRLPYVYTREATLGTGIYLNPREAEPGAAVQAVFDVLGLGRGDVPSDVPPSVVAERVDAYQRVHPGQTSLRVLAFNPGSGELLADALTSSVLGRLDDEDGDVAPAPPRIEVVGYCRRRSLTDPLPALTDLQGEVAARQVQGARSYLTPPLGISVRSHDELATESSAAHLAVVADLALVDVGGQTDNPDVATSFRNLLTPASNRRVAADGLVAWQTSPALRPQGRVGAADAVDAHRAYGTALAAALGLGEGSIALTAALGTEELAALRSAHQRADWVLTLDRHLGIDLYTAPSDDGRSDQPYILDYAPDFLEGLGPRLTVTTSHRNEVHRLLADAMTELNLAAVDESVRDILGHLQVVSGRLALRLVGRSTLATEAVSLAALIASLRSKGELRDTIVVPVDAHQDVFGDTGGDAGIRRCDVILVRATARTLRMECVEVKSRRAAALPTALADEIVDQLESTVAMLSDTFFRTDPPRIDAELQRARLVGILRHHAYRAQATGLLDSGRRADLERLLERMEDGAIVPEISKTGYVVSLGDTAGLPREHRGVRINILTAADLDSAGLAPVGPSARQDSGAEPEPSSAGRHSDGDGELADSGSGTPQPGAEPDLRQSSLPATWSTSSEGSSDQDAPRSAPPVASTDPLPADSEQCAEVPSGEVRESQDPSPTPRQVSEPKHQEAEPPQVVDVHLGRDAHAADVRWRISTSGSPHMFVLGIPGQGKSVTTRRVLNAFAEQGLPALVLDFHGDMAAAPAGGAAVLNASDGLDLSPFELRDGDHSRYAEAAWELSEVIGYVCELGEIQQNVVYEAVRDLYSQHGFGTEAGPSGLPTMVALADAVAARERGGRGRNVAARLRPLTDFGLFVDRPGDRSFAELLRTGVVLDVHEQMEQVQLAAGAFVLRKVYREMFQWGQTTRLRLAVVLDEAHRLARDVTLPKIMKEGRKYGVAVVVASQGVDDFHRDVLSNAGTKVAFRCNFPQSRKVAGFLRGRMGQDMSTALENLAVGQAYISTPEHAEARKVFMSRS